jgi:hypothetical protein
MLRIFTFTITGIGPNPLLVKKHHGRVIPNSYIAEVKDVVNSMDLFLSDPNLTPFRGKPMAGFQRAPGYMPLTDF